jgi:hypothetical protein
LRHASLPLVQPAISSSVRRQPVHQPLAEFILQILTQGLAIVRIGTISLFDFASLLAENRFPLFSTML